MQHVKVSELASEFEIKSAVVISELKKVGVWVPSADTPVDHDIADRLRRRLQLMVELEQQEEEKAKEKKEKKKKKVVTSKARKSIKQLGKTGKGIVKVADEEPPTPWLGSMKPRKGQASYRKVELPDEEAPAKVSITIEDEPIIEKVEAHISAEELEKALTGPSQAELDKLATAKIEKKVPAKPPVPPEKVEEPEDAAKVAEQSAETPGEVEGTPAAPGEVVADAAEAPVAEVEEAAVPEILLADETPVGDVG